jgi:hypothetical protein
MPRDTPDLSEFIDWAPADGLIDPWDTLPVLQFPDLELPAAIERYAVRQSLLTGVDSGAMRLATIHACSAAMHGEVKLRLTETWDVRPAWWFNLVGNIGTGKSLVFDRAYAALEAIQQQISERFMGDHRAWTEECAALKRGQKKDPEPRPVRQALYYSGTIEGLRDLLQHQPAGTTYLADELAGFIGSIDKYNQRGGADADRGLYLASRTGGPKTIIRAGRTIVVPNFLMQLGGGISPEKLAELGAGLTEDGMLQRSALYILPQQGRMRSAEPDGSTEAFHELTQQLFQLDGTREDIVFGLSNKAAEQFASFCEVIRELRNAQPIGLPFAGFCNKLPLLWGNLALTLHCCESVSRRRTQVSEQTAETVTRLIRECLIPNAAFVYMNLSGGHGYNIAAVQGIASFLLRRDPEQRRVRLGDFNASVRACRTLGSDELTRLVKHLWHGGWLEPEDTREREPRIWLINPAVFPHFAAKRRQEFERARMVRELIADAVARRRDGGREATID